MLCCLTFAASYKRRPAVQNAGAVYRDFNSVAERWTMSWNSELAAMLGSASRSACRSAKAASKVVFLASLVLMSAMWIPIENFVTVSGPLTEPAAIALNLFHDHQVSDFRSKSQPRELLARPLGPQ